MPENEPHADPHPMVVQNVNPAGPVADPLAGQPLVVKVLVTVGLVGFLSLIAWLLIERQAAMLKDQLDQSRQDRLFERQQAHDDRMADQQAFRESVKALQDQADRHTGELKGSMDGNTGVLRELIAEMKSAKREGRAVPIPTGAMPRPMSPSPP
jgi:hypothetical protein